MDPRNFPEDITFSDTMSIDPNVIFSSVPTLDDIQLDNYPDPEGYSEQVYDDYDDGYGNMYELDFADNY